METVERLVFSTKEAASILSISRPTLYELLNRKDGIDSFKLGSRRMIPRKSIEDWIARQINAEQRVE